MISCNNDRQHPYGKSLQYLERINKIFIKQDLYQDRPKVDGVEGFPCAFVLIANMSIAARRITQWKNNISSPI